MQIFTKHSFLIHFALKQNMEKVSITWPKQWTNPFGKKQILGILNRCVYGLKRLLFFLELRQAFVLIYFVLKQNIEKVSIFF